MASPTRWTWVWVNSGSWWWTGRPGMQRSMESQRVGHDWATELKWINLLLNILTSSSPSLHFSCSFPLHYYQHLQCLSSQFQAFCLQQHLFILISPFHIPSFSSTSHLLVPLNCNHLSIKCLPPMRETWVRSLGREDPLEKGMATHSSILAWRIPWTEEPGRLQFTGSQRVGHDWVTSPSLSGLLPIPVTHLWQCRRFVVVVVFN